MATASLEMVKDLRERTGAGMMDCKAALEASGGEIEKAIDFLRKKGMAQAAKRAGRDAKEGLVVARLDGKKGALLEANCETDFVARTDDFKNLVEAALEAVMAQGEGAIASEKIAHRLVDLSGKIGEKLTVRRAKLIESASGSVFSYVHFNNKLGALVELTAPKAENNQTLAELGKDIAMQVANSNPLALNRQGINPATLEREKAIFREEVKGKPENIVEKIIQGKLEKFYQTHCLLEQPFIKDDKRSISQLLEEASKKLGGAVEIKQFARFQLGEGVAAS